MRQETINSKPDWTRMIVPALVALGFLVLISRFLPFRPPAPALNTPPPHPPRQRVVIFIVDTSDYFDAHGTYVRSVIQRHCPRCDVQQVNLHGNLSLDAIVQAIQDVQNAHRTLDDTTASLVNLSLGTYTYDEMLHAKIRQLEAEGVIMIASAGNDNTSKPFYPAAFPEVLGVCSSTRYTKTKTAYSNFGDWVSLCAPGLQYVTRPLQHGELASGTSFASPMVAGVLGQILLEAPCATQRTGRRALLRTTDPIPGGKYHLGAGILNPVQAGRYMRGLYTCQHPESVWNRGITRLKRLATHLGISLSVIVYFFVSIFTVPFLLAFVIEKIQRRAEQHQQQAIYQAYADSPVYRRQRVCVLKRDFLRRHKVRRRHQAELYALLHALHLYHEPCWWCGKSALSGEMTDSASELAMTICTRCGLEPSELNPNSLSQQNP